MKWVLLPVLILTALMPPSYAGRVRPSLIRELVRKTPWQNIAAGGVAAGSVIVAYKVGNGVESGLRTVAKESPDTFAACVTPLRFPLQAVFCFLIGSGIVLVVRLFLRKNRRAPAPNYRKE